MQNLSHEDPPEPTRRLAFKNYPDRVAHEVPYSEPPLPTFSPSEEDEALI